MTIEFNCPTCQTRIRTPDEAAGKKARCPTCQAIVPIPANTSYAPLSGLASAPTNSPAPTNPQPLPKALAPWLPPADAFAPKGPAAPDYHWPQAAGGHAPPIRSNPFGDGAAEAYALTTEEVRQKLLGPAIGLALTSLLCLGVVVLFTMMIVMSPEFQQDMQNKGNQPEIIAACIILGVLAFAGALPYFIALIGAYAMFRGRGVLAAWIGAIAGLLPCNPFFILTAGFALWGMVVLNDPRVQQGMK